jgi:hypothetical protein
VAGNGGYAGATASPSQTGTGGAGTATGGAANANGGGATSGPATVNNTATISQSLPFNLAGLTLTINANLQTL